METRDLKTKLDELIEKYDEYIVLLGEEIDKHVGLSYARGWRGDDESYNRGKTLREDIERLKEQAEVELTQNMMSANWMRDDLLRIKMDLMSFIKFDSFEIVSYFPYPSVIVRPFITSNSNEEWEAQWMRKMDGMIQEKLAEVKLPWDNKIVIELSCNPGKTIGGKKITNQRFSNLFYAYKDGISYIGFGGIQKDNRKPIIVKNLKNKKNEKN